MSKEGEYSLFSSTLIVLIVLIAAKTASFITEAITAAYLGVSWQGDAYYMISGIHQVLYPMLSIGIWKIFLPEYKKTLVQGTLDEATSLANKSIFIFVAISIVFAALLALSSPLIVALVAPGFDGQTRDLCIELVRISSPMYIFIIASSMYAAMLQSHNKFFASQIREVATYIPTILAALFLFERYGVYALAISLVVGGLFRLLIELPFLKWGYKFKFDYHIRDNRIAKMMKAMPAALIASGADQIAILINKVIASFQGVGAVSTLNYASKLQNVFIGLFSSAIITASYPKMAEVASEGDVIKFSKSIRTIIISILAFMVPVSLGCVLFSTDLVDAAFKRGAFDYWASLSTARAFSFYAMGILFAALFSLFNNVFYVYGKANLAMYISVLTLMVGSVLSFLFSLYLGTAGIALSASITYIIAVITQIYLLKDFVMFHGFGYWQELIKVAGSSAISCPIAFFASRVFGNVWLRLLFGLLIAIGIYFLALRLLNADSYRILGNAIARRIRRGK